MGTIAQELTALTQNKAAIKAAIEAKNPSVMPGDDLGNWPSSIESIPTGSKVTENDVIFIDYDGTILYSYSAEEVANLTELPPLPTQPGLTCQGWNWSLANLKEHVSSYGRCVVGATYITDDGKTRVRIKIPCQTYVDIPFVIRQDYANSVKVNWGDGSPEETYSSTAE